jgi:hypothetical protein
MDISGKKYKDFSTRKNKGPPTIIFNKQTYILNEINVQYKIRHEIARTKQYGKLNFRFISIADVEKLLEFVTML